MKKFLTIVLFCVTAITIAESPTYKIPKELEIADFQTHDDRKFLDRFREMKIPLLLRKAIKTEHELIVPWIRETTADLHDYQLTIENFKRGVLVTDDQFGWLKKEVEICAEILGLEKVPHVFVIGESGMKAEVVNFVDPMILLSSDLVEKSTPIALRFAIGQQMGHILCDHIFFESLFSGGLNSLGMVLGKFLQQIIESFVTKISDLVLVDWTLAKEISADRAGLIACQDLRVAQQTMINFKLAIDVRTVEIDPEDYIRQSIVVESKRKILYEKLPKSAQDGLSRWERSQQLASDQPFMFQRFKALGYFYDSENYRKILSEVSNAEK